MNNKGQALVEFILLLPIFTMIMLFIIDICNITYKKYNLEKNMEVITELYKSEKTNEINSYIKENKINIEYENNNDLTTITIKEKINTITPILSAITKNNYYIETNRIIYEKQ